MNLKQQTFSAVRWTAIAMVGKAGMQFLQVVILARLLSPADFGLMALVIAVIAFVEIFADMGVSNAIIHHQNISHEELSSLYWLNVCAGGVLMLVLMVLSSPISYFYKEPSLQPLLMIVSIYIFLSALGQQLRVVAEKELRFAVLARIELMAAAAGFATAVIWVLLSPTVTALVAGIIASALVMTSLYWLILANGWRPMQRLKLGEIRRFLSFGGYTMANNLVNTFNCQADIFIGGRLLPTESLGVYSLPRDLSLRLSGVINPIVTRVGLPVMAKAQHDKLFLKDVYLKTLRMTASVNFPLYLALAVFAPEIVLFFFGTQWGESVPLLRVLAMWGMIRSVGNPVGSLLFATGRADLSFKWNMALLILIAPVIWLGAQWGAIGLAISQLALMIVLFIPGWFFLIKPLCGVGLWEYTLNVLIPLAASLAALLVAYIVIEPITAPLPRLFVGLIVAAIFYIIMSSYINRQWIESMRTLLMKG